MCDIVQVSKGYERSISKAVRDVLWACTVIFPEQLSDLRCCRRMRPVLCESKSKSQNARVVFHNLCIYPDTMH